MGFLTIGDIFRVVFGAKIELAATIFMVPVFFGFVAAQLVALVLILGTVTTLTLTKGILISAGILVLYTFLSEMWAIHQRVMSSKSKKAAFQSTYLAGGFYRTFGLRLLFIALGAKVLYPELYLENKQMLLPSMVLAHVGLPVQIIFFGALISAIMNTASSSILAPSALISENLVQSLFKDRLSDRHLLLTFRTSIVFVAIISVFTALQDANVYELVAGASILLLVSLFIPLIVCYVLEKSIFRHSFSFYGSRNAYLINGRSFRN